MNKPAPKEPSMEEILSSIRQIIADDDAARPGQAGLASSAGAQGVPVSPANPGMPEAGTISGGDEVLPLSPDQIVREEAELAGDEKEGESVVAEFLDPDDVAFEPGSGGEAPSTGPADDATPAADAQPARADPLAEASASPSAPAMPDPKLSQDMAQQLLEPASRAAVTNSIARLTNFGIGTQGLTLEDLTRELLRPMLKQWLDEHLPSVVERVVEREIARISRGE